MARKTFLQGRKLFRASWKEENEGGPMSGLGPFFSSTSCLGCHANNGRGSIPTSPYQSPTSSVTFFKPTPSIEQPTGYGQRIDYRVIRGLSIEADIKIRWEHAATYNQKNLYKPIPIVSRLGYGEIEKHFDLALKISSPIFGLGLIDAIPDNILLANHDPEDRDKNGISGKAGFVKGQLARFGKQADSPSIENFIAKAMHLDMGLTSKHFPKENCSELQPGCKLFFTDGPEVSESQIETIAFYLRRLGAPTSRVHTDSARNGQQLFSAIGCASCHQPTFSWTVGEQEISVSPYSDFMLHNLSDKANEQSAAALLEWKTTPLWGIGLTNQVNGNEFYLHDGRARSIQEAIYWHGGEAAKARERYSELNNTEQADLLNFLGSL